MRITNARLIVCSPGRNFVTLKIETEAGIYGLGDATLNGRELAVASYLGEHVLPLLIGRDARRIEDTWHYLYKGAYWRGGPVGMTAIGTAGRSPRRMTEPLPNCLSICARARSSAFSRSGPAGIATPTFAVLAAVFAEELLVTRTR